MPMNRSLYPDDWEDISNRIRGRAKNCCEVCGVPNHMRIVRHLDGIHWRPADDWFALDERWEEKVIRIILTVGHLDHNPQNNADSNLLCMCQRCHNAYDGQHRRQNAIRTRREKQIRKTGQLSFFVEDS